MHSKLTSFAALAALAAGPVVAHADDGGISRLIGTWKGSGTLTMGTDVAKVTVTLACKATSAKAGVLCTMRGKGIPGLPVFEETDLFALDAATGMVHWYAVTNTGEVHDHVGKSFAGAATAQFAVTGTADGKPMRETIDFTFGAKDRSVAVKSETTLGGAAVAVLAIEAKR